MLILYPPRHDPVPAYETADMDGRLAQFEEILHRSAPAILENLSEPAAEDSIMRLVRLVAPYQPPRELLALYRWHDGQRNHLGGSIFPPFQFLSLEEALEHYARMQKYGWIKPWFPIFRADGTYYLVAMATEQRSSPVFLNPKDDTDLTLRYENLECLIQVACRAYETELILDGRDWAWVTDPRFKVIHSEINSRAFAAEPAKQSPHMYSKHMTHVWPLEWKEAIGRSVSYYEYRTPTATVADVARMGPGSVATVHANLGRLSGRGPFPIFDDTGEVEASCSDDARRELQNRVAYELDILALPIHEHPRFKIVRALRISEGRH